jgi:hypothetical protein
VPTIGFHRASRADMTRTGEGTRKASYSRTCRP